MNEQIKELWNKADLQDEGNPPSIVITSERKMQKFAELIVRECIEQCNKKDPRPDRYSDWEEFAESRKVRECITSIKEHFGVE